MSPRNSRGLPSWDRGRRGEEEPPGLGAVLDGMLGTTPWNAGLAVGRLARTWEEVVGERLAAESAPVRLDDHGTLFIRVSSGAWGAQLRFLAADIGAAANRALGADRVRDVRVTVAGGPEPSLGESRFGVGQPPKTPRKRPRTAY